MRFLNLFLLNNNTQDSLVLYVAVLAKWQSHSRGQACRDDRGKKEIKKSIETERKRWLKLKGPRFLEALHTLQ